MAHLTLGSALGIGPTWLILTASFSRASAITLTGGVERAYQRVGPDLGPRLDFVLIWIAVAPAVAYLLQLRNSAER